MPDLLPKSNEAITEKYEPVNVNQKHRQNLGFQDRLAATITSAVGTMYTMYLIMAGVLGWMLWQTIITKPFDPYPFAFMVFLSNIVQLLLMPLLMVGQNVQGRHAEMRAEEEYKMTKYQIKEMKEMMDRLEKMERKLDNLK